MEILIDVVASADGRLNGSLRAVGYPKRETFSGTMELIACLEEFCRRNDEHEHRASDQHDDNTTLPRAPSDGASNQDRSPILGQDLPDRRRDR